MNYPKNTLTTVSIEAAAQVLESVQGGDSVPEPTSAVADPAVQSMIDEVTRDAAGMLRLLIDEVSAAISQILQNAESESDGGGQDGNMFVPFVRGIMQFLLSKEVLYPALMELVDMYQAWLADNKGKIEQSEYDRFSKQLELMQQVCAVLEPEQESDPEDVKWQRFLTVLDLLQRLEDLGEPPTEIAELVDDIGFTPAAPDAGQCCVM